MITRSSGSVTDNDTTPGASATDDPDLDAAIERALTSVPGVCSAEIQRHDGHRRLRVRLLAGEAPEHVARAIAATLDERFGIELDPSMIRPLTHTGPARAAAAAAAAAQAAAKGRSRPPPSPASPAGPPERALITDLEVISRDGEVRVRVSLSLEGRTATGVTRAAPTDRSTHRALADATASALQQLTVLPLAIRVERIELAPGEDPEYVLASLTLTADRGEEPLLGCSFIRADLDRAVVRATLDALNRRVEPLLHGPPAGH